MSKSEQQLESLNQRIVKAGATISYSRREIGFLKSQRVYWLGGKKNDLAGKLENRMFRAEARRNRLIVEMQKLEAEIKTMRVERSEWTRCLNNHIDRTGGATCPECGAETEQYIAE